MAHDIPHGALFAHEHCSPRDISVTVRLIWERPRLVPLPHLTELTLQTGGAIPGSGGSGGGGSTVF